MTHHRNSSTSRRSNGGGCSETSSSPLASYRSKYMQSSKDNADASGTGTTGPPKAVFSSRRLNLDRSAKPNKSASSTSKVDIPTKNSSYSRPTSKRSTTISTSSNRRKVSSSRGNKSERDLKKSNDGSVGGGIRLSDFTAISTGTGSSGKDYDYDYDSDDDSSIDTNAAAEEQEDTSAIGRTIFHKIADQAQKVVSTASASARNLTVISEQTPEQIPTGGPTGANHPGRRGRNKNGATSTGPSQHRSNYLKNRVSIKVRRASDFLFGSSHHASSHARDDDEDAYTDRCRYTY